MGKFRNCILPFVKLLKQGMGRISQIQSWCCSNSFSFPLIPCPKQTCWMTPKIRTEQNSNEPLHPNAVPDTELESTISSEVKPFDALFNCKNWTKNTGERVLLCSVLKHSTMGTYLPVRSRSSRAACAQSPCGDRARHLGPVAVAPARCHWSTLWWHRAPAAPGAHGELVCNRCSSSAIQVVLPWNLFLLNFFYHFSQR